MRYGLGFLRIIAPLSRLKKALNSAYVVLGSENLLLKFIEKQLNRIKLIRFGGVITLLLIGSYILRPVAFPGSPVLPVSTSTNTPTMTSIPTDTPIITVTATNTTTPTLTSTPTQAMVPTPNSVLGYGRLTSNFFPLQEPNGARVQHLIDGGLSDLMLNRRQFVTVVDSKFSVGGIWYRCLWELNGVAGEGWILDEHIEFVPPPTPTLAP